MPVSGPGPYQLRALSRRLRDAGTEGQGLRRELYKAINEAVKPLAAQVKSTQNLYPHMPDHYADVLAADLSVTVVKRGGRNPSVSIRAKGKAHKRKVAQLDAGVIVHPVFADSGKPRATWQWSRQTRGMKAGFFTDVMERGAPAVQRQVLAAMHDVGKRITGG
jgi:hypothetical protein